MVCSLLALLSYHFGVLFSILAVTYLLCPNSYSILAASTYRDLFFFGWGKNATFAFRELDKIFPKIADVPALGTVKSYAQNSLQAAERSVVMQWRDR